MSLTRPSKEFLVFLFAVRGSPFTYKVLFVLLIERFGIGEGLGVLGLIVVSPARDIARRFRLRAVRARTRNGFVRTRPRIERRFVLGLLAISLSLDVTARAG